MNIKFRLDARLTAVGSLVHQQRIQNRIAAVVQVKELRRRQLLGVLLQVGALLGICRQTANDRHMVVDIMLHLTDLLLLFLQQRIITLLHFGGFQLRTQLGIFTHVLYRHKQRQVAQNAQHQRRYSVGVVNGGFRFIGIQHHCNNEQNEL